jgi:hypothetical protein
MEINTVVVILFNASGHPPTEIPALLHAYALAPPFCWRLFDHIPLQNHTHNAYTEFVIF